MRASGFLSILLFSLMLGSAQAQSGAEAGDQYFKGFLMKNDAERREQAADYAGAQQKYQEAYQVIAAVGRNFPTWQPEVVSYRLKMIEAALQRLASKAAAAPPAPVVPAPAVPAPGYTPTPPAPPQYGTPIPNAPAPPPAGGTAALANPLDIINQSFKTLQDENAEMKSKLELYKRGYTGELEERNRVTKEKEMLVRQLQELQGRIGAVERDATADSAAQQKQLAKLKDEAKMVNEMLASDAKVIVEKDKTIASLESQKNALLDKQQKTENELADLKKNAVPKGDVDKLVAENGRLKQELEDTRQQVVALKASTGKKDDEIASLKTQLGGIQSEVAKLRQENTAYQGQVAELTTKLKELDAQLADNTKKSEGGVPSGKLTEENQALRNIILRQLRQQERQRQAKELVIAEMKKMENSSHELMDNLEAMTSAKVVITMDEENLFSEKELREIAAASAPRATLFANSGKSHSPASNAASEALVGGLDQGTLSGPSAETVDGLIAQAERATSTGNYKTAESSYQDALRADPKNTKALLNLAVIKQLQHQYDDAKVLLQKCLVYDQNNEQAYYHLGGCYFQQSQFPEAMSSFEKSLALNPSSARTHHFMGIIASHMGNRDRAESEFKQSLAIDPKYGDAHFNLAVLYATDEPPNLNLAREHYQHALDRGVKADPDLEKILKKNVSVNSTGNPSTAAAH